MKGTKSLTGKADVYSIGVILYSLLFKDLTVQRNSDEEDNRQRPLFDFSESQWANYPAELKIFIMNCVAVDVSKRASIEWLLQENDFMQMYHQGTL